MSDRRNFLRSLSLTAATVVTSRLRADEVVIPAAADPASAGARARPNVILIVSDEHQAQACGCYGATVRTVTGGSPTPHVDALAQEGVRFGSMYCASPLCAPSRAAYMTGMYPHTTTALHHKMQRMEAGLARFPGVRADIPGLGQYFRDAGYRTAAIGKMHVHGEQVDGWDLGFDERELRFYTRFPGRHYADLNDGDLNRRYREMPPYAEMRYREIDGDRFAHAPEGLVVKRNGVNEHGLETLVEHEDEMFDALVTARSLAFIEAQAAAAQPFLIHVGLEKPHRPWTVHQTYLDRFDPATMPLPATTAEWVEKGMFPFCQAWTHSGLKGEAARRSMAAYYACAAQVDDCVGRIMDQCRRLGLLENTVIVYTSDHGESLYEHGLIEKHNMLDPAARVPFVIRAPWALPVGALVDAPASLVDLLPTVCGLTGVAPSPRFEGISLLPMIAGEVEAERLVFSEFYQDGSVTRRDEYLPVRMGLNRTHKYVYTHGAADQLYDRLANSEATLTNLAFDPAHDALVSRLRLCTLDGWELDEFPQLEAAATVTPGGVQLTWESAGPGVGYDVYRSPTGNPLRAERLAAGVATLAFVDPHPPAGATCTYWILGRDAFTVPYTDPRGKQRYGDQPILTAYYRRMLPVTPRLTVDLRSSGPQAFRYQPLLPCRLAGRDWIHIGQPPVESDDVGVLRGAVTVLSPRAATVSRGRFAADIRTLRAGFKAEHTLKLLFGYQNMEHHYLVGLERDGTFGLWRQVSEWKREALATKRLSGVDLSAWHRVEVRFEGGRYILALNGEDVITGSDPDPLPPGRFGFDVPLPVTAAEVRNVVYQ